MQQLAENCDTQHIAQFRQRDTRRIALWMAHLSAVTFVFGVFSPSFTVRPSLGDPVVNALIRDVLPEFLEPQTFSLARGIWVLFADGETGLGLIITTFSVAFPTWKLVVLHIVLMTQDTIGSATGRHRAKLNLLSHFGGWSMLDVFIVAVIVVGFKEFPSGTRVDREFGLFIFAVSILLCMASSALAKKFTRPPSSDVAS